MLLRCSKESLKNSATEAAKPAKPDEKGEMQVCTLFFTLRFQVLFELLIITRFPEYDYNEHTIVISKREVSKAFKGMLKPSKISEG